MLFAGVLMSSVLLVLVLFADPRGTLRPFAQLEVSSRSHLEVSSRSAEVLMPLRERLVLPMIPAPLRQLEQRDVEALNSFVA